MLKPLLTSLIAVTGALSAHSALARGFYVSGSLDGVFRQDTSEIVNEAADPFGNRAPVPYQVKEENHYEAGGEVDAAGGYRFGLGRFGTLRVEGEFSFRDFRVKDYTLQSLPGQVYGTDFHSTYSTTKGLYEERYAETANAFYDLPTFGFATPYIGAGVGYQESVRTPGDRLQQYQDTRYSTGSIFGPVSATSGSRTLHAASSSTNDGTWLAEAGMSLRMTPHLSLVPSYRFTQAFAGDVGTNLAWIGLRYSF